MGILKDDLHPPPDLPQFGATQRPHVTAGDCYAAGCGFDEPEDAAADRRLSAATLADEAERAAAGDRETNPVDRPHRADLPTQQPTTDREVRRQIGDGDERGVGGVDHERTIPTGRGSPSLPA